MKKIYIIATLATLSLTSCTVIAPITASRAELGTARGISETTSFLGIEFNKNYGVKEAANNGKIKTAIATVDEKVTNYYIFKKKQLIVTAK